MTQSETLATRHGRGRAGVRHGTCELAFTVNRPSRDTALNTSMTTLTERKAQEALGEGGGGDKWKRMLCSENLNIKKTEIPGCREDNITMSLD
jgi:hypothetical protein